MLHMFIVFHYLKVMSKIVKFFKIHIIW